MTSYRLITRIALLTLLGLLVLLWLVARFADRTSEPVPQVPNDISDLIPAGDGPPVSEAEAALEIHLPPRTTLSYVITNDQAVGILGQAPISLSDARAWFDTQLHSQGGTTARRWTISPGEQTHASSSYIRAGENWNVSLTVIGSAVQFDITRQFATP